MRACGGIAMRNTWRISGAGVLVVALAWLSYQVKREVPIRPLEALDVGDAAPGFTLRDLKGGEVSLHHYRGQVVVLNFWTTSCPQRRLGLPLLDGFQREEGESRVVVLSINFRESAEQVRDSLKDGEHAFRVLLDTDGLVAEAYGVKYVPTVVMVNQKGKIAWVGQGYLPDLPHVLARQLKALGATRHEEERPSAGDLD